MSKMKTLNDGLLDNLKDIYSAETQLLKALPKMEKKATNEKLQKLFATHKKETEEQVERLEEVASIIESKLTGKKCKAMEGLIKEGSEALELESDNDPLIDSMIAGAALRVECYEIAAYESAIAMASEVGQDKIKKILEESLAEEQESYSKLTKLCKQELFPDTHLGEEEGSSKQSKKAQASKTKKRGSSDSMRAGGAARLAVILAMGAALALPASYATADNSDIYGNRDGTTTSVAASQYNTKNIGENMRDTDEMAKMTDSQSFTEEDNQVLADIRRRLVTNDDISTSGKNIKVVVKNGTVTLHGPVKSADERDQIERSVAESASDYRVINQLHVERG